MDLPRKRENETEYNRISECFFEKNPIGRMWEPLPDFKFYRFVPTQIHYVGGFGGSHYIGWLNMDMYKKAPKNGLCSDWGEECRKLGEENGIEFCCPVGLDNDMHECCLSYEKTFNFEEKLNE